MELQARTVVEFQPPPTDRPGVLRWFYIGVGCMLAASLLYVESVRRTGREPAALVAEVGAPTPPAVPDLSPPGLPTLGAEPVLVFYVNGPRSLGMVRDAIDPGRIVAARADGFALREGRIVALGPVPTSALLNDAGWGDRPLEIHRPAPRPPSWQHRAGQPPGRAAGGADLNALAHKSHLSRPEAMAVLEQLH